MKKKRLYFVFILFFVLVSECVSSDYETIVFHKLPINQKITFAFDNSTDPKKDLEYSFFMEKLKKKLETKQFVEDKNNPDLFVHLQYGLLGDATGINRSFFLGTPSTYAITRKTINIKMYDKNKDMIYQSETVSEEGDKDSVFEVFDDMLQDMFKEFPGKSGTKRD
ncbi:MAG: DUF4136 domain-containing protein [Pseudomonadota bacterium]